MRTHQSHKTYVSFSSSLYDEFCVYCGATDGRPNDLVKPCPVTDKAVRDNIDHQSKLRENTHD